MKLFIKIIISLILLCCLFRMPYGYYQAVRFVCLLGFTLLAYKNYEKKNIEFMLIYVGLAVLFQTFIKITIGRNGWQIVDILVVIGLISSILFQKKD